MAVFRDISTEEEITSRKYFAVINCPTNAIKTLIQTSKKIKFILKKKKNLAFWAIFDWT